MGWQRYVSIALLLVIASSMALPLSLGESSRIYANPSGVVNISSAHVELEIPPGGIYAVRVDPTRGVVEPGGVPSIPLPPVALEALNATPQWIRPLLERQFELLMRSELSVEGSSTVSIGDVNGDGLPDLAVGSSSGLVRIYLNVGSRESPLFKLFTTINVSRDLGIEPGYVAPALGDLDGDGLVDIVVGLSDGFLVFYRNKGTASNPIWVLDKGYLEGVKVGGYATPFIYDVNNDGVEDLVIGSLEGLVYCFINNGTRGSPSWVSVQQYFPAWIEDWGDGRGPHYEGVWVGNYSKPAVFKLGGTLYLVIGNSNGELYLFKSTGSTGYPAWSNLGKLEVSVSSYAAPAVGDINGDNLPDLLIGAGDGKVYISVNFGSPLYPGFTSWPSQAEKYLLANWFWGPAYYPTLDILETIDIDTSYVEHYAQLILNTSKPYIDEVAYAIAVDRPSNLRALADRNASYLYVLNAESIYDIAKNLSYVKISEHDDYTTLMYRTENGWEELPRDIYYKYLVAFNRYLLTPFAWPSRYNGQFYRTFLPYDKTYGVSLIERVSNASTLREAAYLADYWLRVDIGAYWHPGKRGKPPGWYNIYMHLNDTEWSILCGEFSIIYEAAARAVLIPTIVVVDMAEDHQFNNFWYNGTWHHVDASSGSSGVNGSWIEYFDPPRGLGGWYSKIGFSYPIEWEEDGMYDPPWRSTVPYAPEDKLANLTFRVVDIDGRPIDGARVEVWSHWPIESGYDTAPYIAGFVFTDMNGEAHFNMLGLGRTNNFTVIVTSRIGSTMFEIHLEKGGVYSFNVTIPGRLPFVALPGSATTPGSSSMYVNVSLSVVKGEQNPPSWIHTLYVNYGYKYYVEFSSGVWVDLFILGRSDYEKLLSNTPFNTYASLLETTSASLVNLPVDQELYIVVSNRRSITTWVQVSLDVSLGKDTVAPATTILSPANGTVVNKNSVEVVVSSPSPDVAYYELSVDGSPYVRFNGTYLLSGLSDGVHTVTVRAVDISGNTGDPSNVTIIVDTTPPVIVVDNIGDGYLTFEKTLTVTGKAVDATEAWLNGEKLSLGSDGSFSASVNLSEGLNTLVFKAVDGAGNVAEKTIRVYYYPMIATKSDIDTVISQLGSLGQSIQGRLGEINSTLSTLITGSTDSLGRAIGNVSSIEEDILAKVEASYPLSYTAIGINTVILLLAIVLLILLLKKK